MSEKPSTIGDSQQSQYLSFRLGDDDYAIDILSVQEIRGWESVRSLPESQPYVKGVLDLRGTIVPIVDLRVRFGLTDAAYTPTTVVIVAALKSDDGAQRLVGVVVDAVSDVLDIAAADVRSPPGIGGAVNRRYLEGMVSLSRGMVLLLSLDRLFEPEELRAFEEMSGG